MSVARKLAWTALLLAATAGGASAQDAAPLTPTQAESLQQALGLADPALLAPEAGRVTVLGDGYVLRLPLDGGRRAAQFWGADYAMRARPLDGGRWAFDQLTPPPLFRVGPDGDAMDPTMRLRTTSLAFAATIDPSHATAGTSRLGFAAMSATVREPHHSQYAPSLTIESGAGKLDSDDGALVAGRTDERTHGELANIRVSLPSGDAAHVLMGDLRVDLQLGGVDPAVATAMRAANDALAHALRDPPPAIEPPAAPPVESPAAPPPAPAPDPSAVTEPPPPPRESTQTALKRLIPLVRAMATSATAAAEADQLNVIVGSDPAVHFDRVRLSLAGTAPGGKLDLVAGVTVEGLSVPDAGPDLAGLVPRRIALAPRLSGITVEDLATIATRLIDDPSFGADNLRDPVVALLSHGPVRAAVTGWDIDLGPTRLHATGTIEASSLHVREASGTADVTATRLDTLVEMLSRNRDRRDLFEALLFLKGLGRTEGDRTIWHVDFHGGKLVVNGQDFSDIVPVEP